MSKIKTATHARHLLGLANARLSQQLAAVVATEAQIVEYTALADTLPEGVAAVKHETYAVGAAVDFSFGREAGRKVLSGVIKAVKLSDKNVPQRYKITVGEGFDAEDYTVFPGAIIPAGGSVEDTVGEDPAEDSGDPLDAV